MNRDLGLEKEVEDYLLVLHSVEVDEYRFQKQGRRK